MKFWMEVDLPASFRVWFTQLTIMSSFAFWPSPRSSRTFSVYLRSGKEKEDQAKSPVRMQLGCCVSPWQLGKSLKSSALGFCFLGSCCLNSFSKKESATLSLPKLCTPSQRSPPFEPGPTSSSAARLRLASVWGFHRSGPALQCQPERI